MKKRYVGKRILALLAREGEMPGLTLLEIGKRLGLVIGTAVGERVRELRGRGYDIRCAKYQDGRYRYWMPYRERQKLQKELAA